KYVSGIILHDETINQKLDSNMSFVDYLIQQGIVAGVRGDNGSEKYKDTEQNMSYGTETLDERFKKYANLGIKFTKWRAGFKVSDIYPSDEFLDESIKRLTEFAKISHKYNLVPFVEPDVEIKGTHTTTRCAEISGKILQKLFESLQSESINLSDVILKTNMILPGVDSGVIAEPLEVANATLRVYRRFVPKEVGGIVLLSGGITYSDSTLYLDKIEDLSKNDPWKISFSFARALQKDALAQWAGKSEMVEEAQRVLINRLQKVTKARMGEL
ncbi:MAG: class I fructose-bisphosphate aldolase, partial [Patescibacteria group bacterium]